MAVFWLQLQIGEAGYAAKKKRLQNNYLKKNIICIAYQQDKLFLRFKEKKKFVNLVKEFKVHKTAMIFKINIVKLTDKYPRPMKLSVTLEYLKMYFKDIKEVCN